MTPLRTTPTPVVIDLPFDAEQNPKVDCGPMIDNPPMAPPDIDPDNLKLIRAIQRWRIEHGI